MIAFRRTRRAPVSDSLCAAGDREGEAGGDMSVVVGDEERLAPLQEAWSQLAATHAICTAPARSMTPPTLAPAAGLGLTGTKSTDCLAVTQL